MKFRQTQTIDQTQVINLTRSSPLHINHSIARYIVIDIESLPSDELEVRKY